MASAMVAQEQQSTGSSHIQLTTLESVPYTARYLLWVCLAATMKAAQSYLQIVHRSVTKPTSYVGIVAEGAIIAAMPGVGGDPVVFT